MAGYATTPGCDLWFQTMYVVIVIMMSRQISGQVVYDMSVYPADVSVTTITLSNLSIIDVYEISNFPAVTTLDFSYNSLLVRRLTVIFQRNCSNCDKSIKF